MQPKKKAHHTISIINSMKENAISAYMLTFVLPFWVGIIFELQTPSTFSTQHTKFEKDYLMQSYNTSFQNLA